MVTDRYTKVVPTIIAAALVWLCVRDVLPVAVRAEQTATSIRAFDERHPLPVKIVSVGRTEWRHMDQAWETGRQGGAACACAETSHVNKSGATKRRAAFIETPSGSRRKSVLRCSGFGSAQPCLVKLSRDACWRLC